MKHTLGVHSFALFNSRLTQERKDELIAWVNSLTEDERKMVEDLRTDARAEDYWPGA